jgi:hypothetical protein
MPAVPALGVAEAEGSQVWAMKACLKTTTKNYKY